MNRHDWKRAFGDVPASFTDQLRATLDGLEDRRMRKRTKFTTLLAAALIAALLITGAAVAATRLGILEHMGKYADPIEPLPGAEELVATDVGRAENDRATLTVEEALYDGQGILLQLRFAPKDPGRDALFNELFEDGLDDYIVEQKPVPVPEDGAAGYIEDGEWVEMDTWERDGVTYYADQYTTEFLGRKDGRTMLNCDVQVEINGGEFRDLMPATTWDAEAQPDGSARMWMEANAELPLSDAQIQVKVIGETWEGDAGPTPMDAIEFSLTAGDARRVRLVPEEDGADSRCRILEGEILFTPIRGYLTVDYLYTPAEGETMGTTLEVEADDGEPVRTDGGWDEQLGTADGAERWRSHWRIQSFDELPEALVVRVRALGDGAPDTPLGRFVCRLEAEE